MCIKESKNGRPEREEEMDEKRKTPRLDNYSKVTITLISDGENPAKENKTDSHRKDDSASGAKIHANILLNRENTIDNHSKDSSTTGAKIQTNVLLNIGAIIMMDFTLNFPQQKIKVNTMGKVKWAKTLREGESYEEGVEFVNPLTDVIRKLEDSISGKLKKEQDETCG